MRKIFCTFIAAVLAVSLLSGCSGNEEPSETGSDETAGATEKEPGSSETAPSSVTGSETDTITDSESLTETETEKPDTQTSDGVTSDTTTSGIRETEPVETDPEQPVSVPASFTLKTVKIQDTELKYWLYTPKDPTDGMTLILYLHGGSGKGDDPTLITAADGFPKYLSEGTLGDVRAYAVIPQLSADKRGWADAKELLIALITRTKSEFSTGDTVLTGHSMGGTGTWSIAAAYPGTFSRIAPLSGSIKSTPDNIAKLKNIPVRAFVGSADKIVPPESSLEFIDSLKKAGGDAGITVFDGADHFSVPALTYTGDTGIIDWLVG